MRWKVDDFGCWKEDVVVEESEVGVVNNEGHQGYLGFDDKALTTSSI